MQVQKIQKSYNTNFNGRYITKFSNKFEKDYLYNLKKNFFRPQTAKLVQICKWEDEFGQEIWVPLLRVEFGKEWRKQLD